MVGRSLVCEPSRVKSDAILIENFDPDYRLFERARDLRADGQASRILVPVRTGAGEPLNAVAVGIADVMARISRIGVIEFVPIREVEPISLNAAHDIRRFLTQRGIGSLILVTPAFRSRRSQLVYDAAVAPSGIRVSCEPVFGERHTESWTASWHGIQGVTEQWLKLQYYRLYVLPFRE